MTDKQILASELFYKGYNCAQSVAGAFADELGMTQDELVAMSAAFGGGFARTRNLCGAVSGMGLVISLSMNKTQPDSKGEVYATVREYTDKFQQRFSTLNCGELLKNVADITSHPQPDERTQEYYRKRPCTAFVAEAAGLLEEFFEKK